MATTEFTDLQKDAIAEVMNISMGNAATAASELLNAKVWITTPRVSVKKASELHDKELEPAVCVKIIYVKGISGSNIMVLKQKDVQLILNQLMGQPLVVTDDFEFDEINISAVSEVMNQMMGASATALSSFLGFHIDISTPQPYIMDEIDLSDIQDFAPDDDVVAVNFDLTIEGVINSEFVSVMELDLANLVADKVMGANPEPESDVKSETPVTSSVKKQDSLIGESTPIGRAAPTPSSQNVLPNQGVQAVPSPQQMYQQPVYPPPMYDQYSMGGQPMPGYPPPYAYGYPPAQAVNIQNAQLHQFEMPDFSLSGEQKENLSLLMNVPLPITVQIGSAKRRVKEILEFTQGTIIELDRSAGAPVDIIVNGNLIAKGDVVVIDDNFAVRISEIIKSKVIESIGKE